MNYESMTEKIVRLEEENERLKTNLSIASVRMSQLFYEMDRKFLLAHSSGRSRTIVRDNQRKDLEL